MLKVPNRYMLDALARVEADLGFLIRGPEEQAKWQSLDIDYHAPRVERLWRDWEGFRVYLHWIHPCEPGEALLHPHPWPSAMKVLGGRYEMGVGYGPGETEPPLAALLELAEGSTYQMIDPDQWHYVRPLDGPALSLMVTGKPWNRPFGTADRVKGTFKEIFNSTRLALFTTLQMRYPCGGGRPRTSR